MNGFSARRVQEELGLGDSDRERLETYVALLGKWQSKINLIGPATLGGVWRRHILDSAQLLPFIRDTDRIIMDLGSGAGLPGLILAILSGRRAVLVESDHRKAAFLREAARLVDASVDIAVKRIEALEARDADLITSRALAPLDKLLEYSHLHLKPGGRCLFLKGRSAADELTACRNQWKMTVVRRPSRSDPAGVVLEIEGLRKVS